ncbi:PQQ-binding-like beta-propeller repeat protein [Dactylosporangium sp. NPDC049742]|uniref:outer membrane protein assembly factor BamB family protein n=1 Tax=Dactylosporangium sp. NPDC049742 TaxID=3154737 RepID=UPI00341B069E
MRWAVAGTIGIILATAACGHGETPDPGPRPLWTVQVETGAQDVAVVGDVAVVIGDQTLLGLDRQTGRELWRRDKAAHVAVVAGDRVVLQEADAAALTHRVFVLDAATGTPVWGTPPSLWRPVVYADAVYSGDCPAGGVVCTLVALGMRDGRELWRLPKATGNVGADTIGRRGPFAPKAGPRLLLTGAPQGGLTLLDPATGVASAASVPRERGWFALAAGDLIVTTDHDPPAGDSNCTVAVTSYSGDTGKKTTSGAVYSGHERGGECQRAFGDRHAGAVLIGAGTRIAAATSGDAVQVYDLATGRTVWRSDERGVPLESDGTTLLVRDTADEGGFRLLDFQTGAVRWKAPDSGLSGLSASWDCALTAGLVAVQGATGDKPFVRVYAARSGEDRGRFGSWLAGLGDDWVATTRGSGSNRLALEMFRVTP